jgi:hypothetical protein
MEIGEMKRSKDESKKVFYFHLKATLVASVNLKNHSKTLKSNFVKNFNYSSRQRGLFAGSSCGV